jgi:hypothetical protein
MRPLPATLALLVSLKVSADKLVCVDDEHNFNLCLNINGLEEHLVDSFVAARNRWDAAIDGDLKSSSLAGINSKYLCNPWPRYVRNLFFLSTRSFCCFWMVLTGALICVY